MKFEYRLILTNRAPLFYVSFLSILYPSFLKPRFAKARGKQCRGAIDNSKKTGVFQTFYKASITNPKSLQLNWLVGAPRD